MASKYELYKQLIKTRQDSCGFIESDHCDSLLFTGLVGCVPGVKVMIDAAYNYADHRWYRRPFAWRSDKTCCDDGWKRSLWQRIKDAWPLLKQKQWKAAGKEFERGGSTISRDMLTGLAWYAWANKRLDISESVVKYALKHWMRMGDGSPSRILIMPALLATYAWISYRLGGPSRWWLRWVPCDLGSKVTDFEAHLQCLHIALRMELAGKISSRDSKTLGRLAEENPHNPLFLAVAGLKEDAEDILDQDWWPEDRLPTSADRAGGWLPERDYGPNYWPSDEGRTHSGGDYLFVKWYLSR